MDEMQYEDGFAMLYEDGSVMYYETGAVWTEQPTPADTWVEQERPNG